MWEYVFASILFLIFIGGIYKYFEEIQQYIIEKILPDKRVENMKEKMAEVELEYSETNKNSNKTHILDSIHKMEKYVKESKWLPDFSKYLSL